MRIFRIIGTVVFSACFGVTVITVFNCSVEGWIILIIGSMALGFMT